MALGKSPLRRTLRRRGVRSPCLRSLEQRADPYGGAIRFGSSYVRLRPEAVTRATFCFPDSVFEPTDFGDADLLPLLCHIADGSDFDDLDECVEAHVHGAVRFDSHVEAVVLDPCFADTDIGDTAGRLGCPIEFHAGFRANPDAFAPDYRGAHIVDLARSLGDELTPEVVGDAARGGAHPPQSIKQVWHCLARYGRTIS